MGKRNFLMKKILLLIFILIGFAGHSQNPLQSVLKTYFRTQPFDMKFSSFVTSLQKDPWFTLEEYSRRTDSNFFFLSGTYKNFNPFRFTPKELRLVVAEEEIIHRDSLHTRDTIINLQLMAITDTGLVNSKTVEKEFHRFNNNQAERFSSKTYDTYDEQGKMTAEIFNYFIFPFSIAPLTIAWGPFSESRNYTFTITIRFKLKENITNFILAPNEQF
jgi:hypothetical protein